MAHNLRSIRKRKGMTQTFIAKKLGISVQGYNAIELGKRRLHVDRAKCIAEILEVDLQDLLYAENLHDMSNCEQAATAETA